jgi:hypothetical protein
VAFEDNIEDFIAWSRIREDRESSCEEYELGMVGTDLKLSSRQP